MFRARVNGIARHSIRTRSSLCVLRGVTRLTCAVEGAFACAGKRTGSLALCRFPRHFRATSAVVKAAFTGEVAVCIRCATSLAAAPCAFVNLLAAGISFAVLLTPAIREVGGDSQGAIPSAYTAPPPPHVFRFPETHHPSWGQFVNSSSLDAIKEELLKVLEEEELNSRASYEEEFGLVPVAREPAMPVSLGQRGLWFLDQLDRHGATAYHIPRRVRLRGKLNLHALERALDRIVARHEALRTHFEVVDGELVQVIRPQMKFSLQVHDLSASNNPEEQARLQAQQEAAQPFDLGNGPLVRGQLLKLGAHEHILLATMHHIVSDGWSMGVLIREFSALYDAFSQGREDPLPALEIQYADYAAWQQRRMTGEVQQRQRDYWKQALSGAPELIELPTDRPRPAVQDYAGDSVDFSLDARLSQGVHALARRQGTTSFNVLLAAWASLAGRLSRQDEVVIGTPVANRTRTEVEPLIGYFVNTLALRIDLSGRPSVRELVRRVHEATLSAQAHQELPFEQVIEAVNPARSLAHAPLFQLMLAWQNGEDGEWSLGQVQMQGLATGNHVTKYDLGLNLREQDGCFAGEMEFAVALYDRDSIERQLRYFRALLSAMVEDDDRPAQQIDLLGATERGQLLSQFTQAKHYEVERSLQGVFEAQAALTPDAIALSDGTRQLSYA
ncbi:MAG: hypothetical protein EOP24_44125, partial [Hyphomicrobiales bacterium]